MDDDGCDPVAEDAIGAVEVFKTIDYCHTETINIYCSEKCYREKRIWNYVRFVITNYILKKVEDSIVRIVLL